MQCFVFFSFFEKKSLKNRDCIWRELLHVVCECAENKDFMQDHYFIKKIMEYNGGFDQFLGDLTYLYYQILLLIRMTSLSFSQTM